MFINKKILVTVGLLSVVVFGAMTSITPKPADEGFKNLKVLPKNITGDQLHEVMEEWEHSLGVHCNFCHVRDEAAKKMDWASDAKPEKEAARDMFKMMNKINQKYFHAKKDSLGMIMHSGVNCNTCHRGTAHPEVVVPEGKRPGGPGQGPGPGAAPGQPAPAGAPDKKE
ncbi:Photosynthetic reaction center cytochrome C subunit [Mucilaginibacter pineti]|uniref:Photosynthetic reaction center cytochrome c subunit n=1 Tax=Mucilaginibacter pineti TaxID=1391627 RepID=A0A1G6XV50_9SPHI|nr:c-type cytochrome [Mucilaginibacter pineti]SDD81563.1 Photosynthetic reaction center cytochrome C subunit [Mucilaginibacter pineti]